MKLQLLCWGGKHGICISYYYSLDNTHFFVIVHICVYRLLLQFVSKAQAAPSRPPPVPPLPIHSHPSHLAFLCIISVGRMYCRPKFRVAPPFRTPASRQPSPRFKPILLLRHEHVCCENQPPKDWHPGPEALGGTRAPDH